MLCKHYLTALRKAIPALLFLLPAMGARAQLYVGPTDPLFITNGTPFAIDSLALTPSTNLTVSNNSIVKRAITIPSINSGITSLNRVYDIGSPIVYTGAIGIFYLDSELGGNTEGQLQIAYNSATAGPWTTTTTSTVNTGTNFVGTTLTAVPLDNVTATTVGVVLPVVYSNFKAQLNDRYVLINWNATSNDDLTGFNLESSIDGRSWKKAAYIPAIQNEETYSYNDMDLDFSIRYYRVAIIEASGNITYTKTVLVRKANADFTLQTLSSGTNRLIKFLNATPDGLQLFDMNGRLLKKFALTQSSYTLGNIPAGAYLVRFKIGSEFFTRKVLMP